MRNRVSLLALVAALGLLGACSGGGGSSTPTPTPTRTGLQVTMPSEGNFLQVEDDTNFSFSIEVSVSGSVIGSIFPDAAFDASLLELNGGIQTVGGSGYRLSFNLIGNPALPAGAYNDTITFRLCADANCNSVHPNTTKTYEFDLRVILKHWETYQRNASQSAHANLKVNPDTITEAWTWQSDGFGFLTPISADGERIYVAEQFGQNTNSAQGQNVMYAINVSNGNESWRREYNGQHSIGPPAVAGGLVAFPVQEISSEDLPLELLNAVTGADVRTLKIASQWSHFLPPVFFEDKLYTAAGYFNDRVYAHDVKTGNLLWEAEGIPATGIADMESVAVDDENVYYYSGNLEVFDRLTGIRKASIVDPVYVWNGYDYLSSPIIGSKKNVFAFSGALPIGEHFSARYHATRPLVNFSIENKNVEWVTANNYFTQPAFNGSHLFIGRNEPASLDMVDQQNGNVVWSWRPPIGSEIFQCNTISTNNAVFVSTDQNVYAIDIATQEVLWTHPHGGCLALAPDNLLVITEAKRTLPYGNFKSTGRMVAYHLFD